MSLGIITAGAIGSYQASLTKRAFRSIGPIVAQITENERHVDEIEITKHPVQQGATITDHMFKKPSELTLRVSWSNSPRQSGGLLGGVAGALGNLAAGTLTTSLTQTFRNAIPGSALGNLAAGEVQTLVNAGAASAVASLTGQINTGTGNGTSTVQDIYQQLLALQTSGSVLTIFTGKKKYTNMLIKSITVETDNKSENTLNAVLVCEEVIIVQTGQTSVTAPASNQANPQATNPPVNAGDAVATPVTDSPARTAALANLDY